MTKFLLALVLLVTGVKVISNSHVFVCKSDLSNLILCEEEGKKEKGDQGKSKYDNDDKVCTCYMLSLVTPRPLTSSKLILPEGTYLAFFNRPNTPPPDFS